MQLLPPPPLLRLLLLLLPADGGDGGLSCYAGVGIWYTKIP